MGFNNSKESQKSKNSKESGFEYNSQSIPLSIANLKLDDDLYEYLSTQEIFTCDEETMQRKYRLNYCVDYPELKKHVYYEGYFHSKRTKSPTKTINPRYGYYFDKPPAPKGLRALLVAFREKNVSFFDSLANLLSKSPNNTSKQLASFFDTQEDKFERILGDLAIQVHFGEEVKGDNLGWHVDGRNSLFHMAISVHGSRALHSKRSKEPNAGKLPTVVEWQNEGEIYVASPALFLHSVEYPNSTWESRTIAIQARFLLDKEDMEALHPGDEEPLDKMDYGKQIAFALQNFPLLLPSLQEVLNVENQLEEFDWSTPDSVSRVILDRGKMLRENIPLTAKDPGFEARNLSAYN